VYKQNEAQYTRCHSETETISATHI